MNLDLITLRLFVAVCEEGSIARAADRQAIVASAVSRRIAGIEEEIGTALLLRRRRGVALTPAGEILLRQAREVLRSMDRLELELRDMAAGVHSHVRVAASPAVLAGHLAEDIGAFLDGSPGAGVSTDERTSPDVLRAVQDCTAEIGILWSPEDLTSAFDVEAYDRDHLCVAVRPEHAVAHCEQVSFVEIIDLLSIGIAPGGMLDSMLRREAALLHRTLAHRMEVSGLDVALRFVSAGLGSAIVPREGALGTTQASSLALVPLSDDWASRGYFIVTRKGQPRSSATGKLVNHLVSRAAERSKMRTGIFNS